jgi:hypothetical protein
MENVLDFYRRPYDVSFAVICMNEMPRQLIRAPRMTLPASPGGPEDHDYEYGCWDVCNVFMACEPLTGKRMLKVTERKTKTYRSQFFKDIAKRHKMAKIYQTGDGLH